MNSKLTGRQEKAAVLAAEDRYTDEQIAAKVGVKRNSLAKWKRTPLFIARVAEITKELADYARRRGIARREHRLAVLQETHNRLWQVIEDRVADPEMASIPGGATGLLVRKPVTSMGVVAGYEYAVDTGTIRELRAIQEQAAKELGQVVEKHAVGIGSLREIAWDQLTDDDLLMIAEKLEGGN